MFDGVEIGLFPLVARPAMRDLLPNLDEASIATWISYVIACFLMGAAIGGVSMGWVGDKIGRVRGMVICMLDVLALYRSLLLRHCPRATCLVPLSRCAWHGRGMVAGGGAGHGMLAGTASLETGRHYRRSGQFRFPVHCAVALTRQVTVDDWRWMMLVGASPAVLALLIVFFVPESERWKAAAKKGGRSPIIEIFRPGLLSKTVLAMAFSGIPLIGTWAAVSGYIPTWADQLKQQQMGEKLLSQENKAKYQASKDPKERTAVLKAALTPEQWSEIGGKMQRQSVGSGGDGHRRDHRLHDGLDDRRHLGTAARVFRSVRVVVPLVRVSVPLLERL